MEKRERLISAHFNIQNNAVVAFSTNNNSSNVRVHRIGVFDEYASIFLMCSYPNDSRETTISLCMLLFRS